MEDIENYKSNGPAVSGSSNGWELDLPDSVLDPDQYRKWLDSFAAGRSPFKGKHAGGKTSKINKSKVKAKLKRKNQKKARKKNR